MGHGSHFTALALGMSIHIMAALQWQLCSLLHDVQDLQHMKQLARGCAK